MNERSGSRLGLGLGLPTSEPSYEILRIKSKSRTPKHPTQTNLASIMSQNPFKGKQKIEKDPETLF